MAGKSNCCVMFVATEKDGKSVKVDKRYGYNKKITKVW